MPSTHAVNQQHGKAHGPRFASTALDIEVISVPLNCVTYPGEAPSTPSSLSRRFMLLDYSPLDRALECRLTLAPPTFKAES